MNLWKVNDMYGRVFYFEDEKKFLRKYKICVKEHGVQVYERAKYQEQANPWEHDIIPYRAVNDEWQIVTPLTRKELDKVVCIGIERQKAWRDNYEKRVALARSNDVNY